MPTERARYVYSGSEVIRLDRFLTEQIRDVSRAYIQELIQKGLVTVNGRATRKGGLVRNGDTVEVAPYLKPDERRIQPNPEISLNIVWESPEMLVLDKPPKLPTHPNDFTDTHTLANAVIARFPEVISVGDEPLRPGIVHRLDTDTSGLILVARTQEAFRYLRGLFDQREVKKTYLALVLGEITKPGEIDTPIAHHPTNIRKMVAVTKEVEKRKAYRSKARESKTLYEPIENFTGYTLLKVRTLTGRMHQVRTHLCSIGHPLAGDRLYQTPQERQKDRLKLDRHFLHAHKLILSVLPSNSLKTFESNIPLELMNVLTAIRTP